MMTIARRLVLLSIISILGVVLVGGMGLFQIRKTQQHIDQIQTEYLPLVRMLGQTQLTFGDSRRLTVLYTAAPDAAFRETVSKQFIGKQTEVAALLDRLAQLHSLASDEQKFLDEERQLVASYTEAAKKIFEQTEANQADSVREGMKILPPMGAKIAGVLEKHAQYYDKVIAQGSQVTAKSYRVAIWLALLTTLMVAAALLFLAWRVFMRVVRPMQEMRDIVNLVETNKDFRLRAKTEGNDEVASALNAFNRLLGSMQQVISEFQQAATVVGESAHGLLATSSRLTESVDQQSQSAASMAGAVEEMTVSISHITSRSSDARQASNDAGELAKSGNAVISNTVREIGQVEESVRHAATQMQDLERQSQQITAVVQVIRDVAEQTNLLALNAAIEAARAGETGRGFAVVADEVRKLAERTAASTREISQMVEGIRNSSDVVTAGMKDVVMRVGSGVESAGLAAQSINEINQRAEASGALIAEISVALGEQNSATALVAQQVERIAQMAENNHSVAEAANTAAGELDEIAERMRVIVQQYKI